MILVYANETMKKWSSRICSGFQLYLQARAKGLQVVSDLKGTNRNFGKGRKLKSVITYRYSVSYAKCSGFIYNCSLLKNVIFVFTCLYALFFSALPESYRCNLCWKNDTTLLVGWVDTVRLCMIRKRSPAELMDRDVPEHIVEPGKELNLFLFLSIRKILFSKM